MDEHLTGKLLIADPFLKDPSFKRSVVFLCEDKEEGSFGFVLNRKFEQPLSEILEGAEDSPLPVYYGGPVQIDTLHYLHLCPDLIPGGIEVVDGIYWGGDFEIVVDLCRIPCTESPGIPRCTDCCLDKLMLARRAARMDIRLSRIQCPTQWQTDNLAMVSCRTANTNLEMKQNKLD